MIGTEATTVIALIVILSFAIDRIVAGILFLLSFRKGWSRRFPDPNLLEPGPEQLAAAKRYKLIYSLLAALLGIIVVAGFGNVRVLATLGVSPHQWGWLRNRVTGDLLVFMMGYVFLLLDILITGLILTAGADRVAHLMSWMGGKGDLSAERSEPKPIQITGKLTLEESEVKRPPNQKPDQPPME